MPSEPENALSDLMRRAQEGDGVAYQTLLSQVAELLRDFLRRRAPNSEATDEIVQETLLSIHRARHTFDPTKPFRPWMFAIARHKLVDFYRRFERTVARETSDEAVLDRLRAPEEAFFDESNFSEVMLEAMEELTVKQRLAIELLKVKGLTIREAATQLEMSESAVKVTAHRAYKALREKLGSESQHADS